MINQLFLEEYWIITQLQIEEKEKGHVIFSTK